MSSTSEPISQLGDITWIQTSPHVTIRPPSDLTGNSWMVEILNVGKSWKMTQECVRCLTLAAKPIPRPVLIRNMQEILGSGKVSEAFVTQLLALNLLQQSSYGDKTTPAVLPTQNLELWNNAPSAGDYHIATLDFPFMDYSPKGSGWAKARERMFKYSQTLPDNNRFKTSYSYLSEVSLPRPQRLMPQPLLPSKRS